MAPPSGLAIQLFKIELLMFIEKPQSTHITPPSPEYDKYLLKK